MIEKRQLTPSLELRIQQTLAGNGVSTSTALTDLIEETERQAEQAVHDAAMANARTIDPTIIDAEAADQARAAELRRDRLVPTLARLQDKLSAALTGERHARWLADFRRVRGRARHSRPGVRRRLSKVSR